jgi:hypothetical protein
LICGAFDGFELHSFVMNNVDLCPTLVEFDENEVVIGVVIEVEDNANLKVQLDGAV